MTYTQILKEIYLENKKWIYIYLTICLVFSMLAFGNVNISHAADAVTATDAVSALGGDFGKVFAPVTQGYLSSIDTPTVLVILCGISLALDYIPESALISLGEVIDVDGLEGLLDYSFGIIDYNVFRVLCLVWFVVTKLLRSNRLTYTTGVILEDVETKIGAVVTFLVVASQFLANIPLQNTAMTGLNTQLCTISQATTISQPMLMIQNGFYVFLCFVLLVSVMVVYFLIRYLFYFIDIVLLPVCSAVDFTSTGLEFVKTVGIVGLLYISVRHPYVFCVIFAMILIVAIVLFKKSYTTIRYFKNIYVKPFFKGFLGFDNEMPLIASKAPKKVKRFVESLATQDKTAQDVQIMIPVYWVKKVPGNEKICKHDRWWFVVVGQKQYICQPGRSKNNGLIIELDNRINNKFFIKKSLRFFEIFNLEDEANIGKLFHKLNKKYHFVFSKEYYYRFDDIKVLTGYTDYTLYRNQIRQGIKLSKKEEREQRRLERLEAKEEKRILQKEFIK